jgi:hypothetical protein
MCQGALLVPCISALCERLDGIHGVKGGVLKLEELPRAAPGETACPRWRPRRQSNDAIEACFPTLAIRHETIALRRAPSVQN